MTATATPRLKAGQRLGDYTVKHVTSLNEIQSQFYLLEHAATGAQHVHVANDDQENTFSVAFKTVPTDATGVAHIL